MITNTPTGSGFIDPFLRFQHNEGPDYNGSTPTEAAFNTGLPKDGTPTGFIWGGDGTEQPNSQSWQNNFFSSALPQPNRWDL